MLEVTSVPLKDLFLSFTKMIFVETVSNTIFTGYLSCIRGKKISQLELKTGITPNSGQPFQLQ